MNRIVAIVAVALAASLAAAGCTGTPQGYVSLAPPEMSVWIVGDSLGSGTAVAMDPKPYMAVGPGAGFTQSAPSLALQVAEDAIAEHGPPETMLVMAGVGDTPGAESPPILAGMEQFKTEMEALGIRLVWIAEPGYTLADELEPLSQWMFTQPESVDCRIHAGSSFDGVHPLDYSSMAECVSQEVDDLGVQFYISGGN